MRLRSSLKAAMVVLTLCALSLGAIAQEARRVLVKTTPVYPEVAKRLSLRGTVKIEITISADGKIKHANVIDGHPILVDAAFEALKECKYEPAKSETIVTVQFDFRP